MYMQIILIPLRTLKGVVLNPIVFMTVLGLVVNVIVFYGVHKGEGSSSENLPGITCSQLQCCMTDPILVLPIAGLC